MKRYRSSLTGSFMVEEPSLVAMDGLFTSNYRLDWIHHHGWVRRPFLISSPLTLPGGKIHFTPRSQLQTNACPVTNAELGTTQYTVDQS